MAKTNAQKQMEQEQAQQEEVSTSTAVALTGGVSGSFLQLMADSTPRSASPFKFLRLVQDNGYSEEVDGVNIDVPFGNFHVSGTTLYAKEVNFRPILIMNKIMKRAGPEEKYKVLGETVYFSDWMGESRIDTLGTTDCGRLFGKAAKSLTPELLELEKKKATLYVDIFGLVYVGNADPVLARLRLSKGKSVRWGAATDQRVIQSHPQQRMFKLKLVLPKNDPLLTPEQQRDANNNSVNLLVSADMSKKLPLEDISTTGDALIGWVHEQNNLVQDKYVAALKGETPVDITPQEIDDLEYVMDAEYEVVN